MEQNLIYRISNIEDIKHYNIIVSNSTVSDELSLGNLYEYVHGLDINKISIGKLISDSSQIASGIGMYKLITQDQDNDSQELLSRNTIIFIKNNYEIGNSLNAQDLFPVGFCKIQQLIEPGISENEYLKIKFNIINSSIDGESITINDVEFSQVINSIFYSGSDLDNIANKNKIEDGKLYSLSTEYSMPNSQQKYLPQIAPDGYIIKTSISKFLSKPNWEMSLPLFGQNINDLNIAKQSQISTIDNDKLILWVESPIKNYSLIIKFLRYSSSVNNYFKSPQGDPNDSVGNPSGNENTILLEESEYKLFRCYDKYAIFTNSNPNKHIIVNLQKYKDSEFTDVKDYISVSTEVTSWKDLLDTNTNNCFIVSSSTEYYKGINIKESLVELTPSYNYQDNSQSQYPITNTSFFKSLQFLNYTNNIYNLREHNNKIYIIEEREKSYGNLMRILAVDVYKRFIELDLDSPYILGLNNELIVSVEGKIRGYNNDLEYYHYIKNLGDFFSVIPTATITTHAGSLYQVDYSYPMDDLKKLIFYREYITLMK